MSNMTARKLDSILARREWPPIGVAVESGTFEGDTTRLLAARFETVQTIELDRVRWERCLTAFANEKRPRIHCFFGNSADIVPALAKQWSEQPIFWYLDAHYTPGARGRWKIEMAGRAQFPLWDELNALAQRTQPDIVIVDDMHAFGRKGEWADVSQESVTKTLGQRVAFCEKFGDQLVFWMKGNMDE